MDSDAPPRRRPAWSGPLTSGLAAAIPPERRSLALRAIKAIHTLIFASVGAAIAIFVWEGLNGRAGSRAVGALSVALAETAVYVSNNQVCPLTPVAEELGAERGSVADIFLPDWASRRIPLVSGSAVILGVALFARARRHRRWRAPSGHRRPSTPRR
jgi:hypothetical protein